MAKVTSKLQVTVPKAVADRFGIRPGDEIDFVVEGDTLRILRAGERRTLPVTERLKLFDESTARQQARNKAWRRAYGATEPAGRGWTREELYTRGRTR
jgi:AbrB family looped-hinge helix DNA binding protein